MQEMQVLSLGWEDPLDGTATDLLGVFHGQRSLVGYSPWDCTELGHDRSDLACTHVYTLHVEKDYIY